MAVPNIPDLSAYDEMYQQAEPHEESFPDVPDGLYNTVIEKLELTTSQSGNPMLKWTLNIVDDVQHTGRKLFRNNMIVSPENLRWLKTDLDHAGLSIIRVSELHNPVVREQLIGVKLQVQKKTKTVNGEIYENIYIRKRLSPSNSGCPSPQGYSPQGNSASYSQPSHLPNPAMNQPNRPQPASNLPRF
jgi:hypothetical protein